MALDSGGVAKMDHSETAVHLELFYYSFLIIQPRFNSWTTSNIKMVRSHLQYFIATMQSLLNSKKFQAWGTIVDHALH